MGSIHATESYSATKSNESLTQATTCVSPGNMMLSEGSQTQDIILCGSVDMRCSE